MKHATLAIALACAHAAAQCTPADIFGPVHQTLTTGPFPLGLDFGDFNADGIPDLAVANSGASTFTFYRGTGDGTFGFATSLGASAHNANVVFGDLTGDGIDDALVIGDDDVPLSNTGGRMVIFRGVNAGGLVFAGAHDLLIRQPSDAAIADLDNDGVADVVVMPRINNAQGNLAIVRGTGSGLFAPPRYQRAINGARQLAVADLNADGVPDLATAGLGFNAIGIHLGFGDATFSDPAGDPSIGTNGGDLALADVNHDGLLDLVGVETNRRAVALGDGTGAFAPTLQVLESSPANKDGMAIGDLNADGNLDIVSADSIWNRSVAQASGLDTISVYFGNGDGTFSEPATYPTLSQPTRISLADVDADGDLDVAYSCRGSDAIQIRLNQCVARPTFAQHPTPLTIADAGDTVTLSATLGPVGAPPFTLQWLRNGQPLADDAAVSGATTDTLTITGVAASDADTYQLAVTNDAATVTSSPAALLVRQPCPADLAANGTLNFDDIDAFVNSFLSGCP